MRLAGTVVSIILMLAGAVWILQGADVLTGSVMSGQNEWLYIGIVAMAAGIIGLGLVRRRRG